MAVKMNVKWLPPFYSYSQCKFWSHDQFFGCRYLYSCQVSQMYLNRQLMYCVLWRDSKWHPCVILD